MVLHVTATPEGFLECAEYLELKKFDANGNRRDFVVKDLDSFLRKGVTYENLLTLAEKQIIVRHGLKSIRTVDGEWHIPGYPHITLYLGQAVCELLDISEISNFQYQKCMFYFEIIIFEKLSSTVHALWTG